MSDRRGLSRRKLLWAVATAGAAASTGSGTAALMNDSETVDASMMAGVLDLDTDPSWGNDSGTGPFGGGTASEGDSGRETVTLSVSSNPSYLWFRTRCVQCEPVEEALFVRFGVDTDGDGTVDRWLSEESSLREAREQFGEGINIGEIGSEDTWEFVVEWEVRENVQEDSDVGLDFDFYAVQSRHVMDTGSVAPDWQCPGGCGGTGGEPDDPSAISWVAFCSSQEFSKDDIEFARSADRRTLTLYSVPSDVDTVLLKYGIKLAVFEYDQQTSITVGGGDTTYTQQRSTFPNTEPRRSNSTPCPEHYGCKYEFADGDESGIWECKDSRTGSSRQSIRSGSTDIASTGGED